MGSRRGQIRTTTYGQKGGEGATRGRKAETLIDPVGGHRKRVFFGQRWLYVVQHDENDKPMVRAYHSKAEAEAQQAMDMRFWTSRGNLPMVEYVIEGRVA